MPSGAAHFNLDRTSAFGMGERHPSAVGAHPLIGPLHQPEKGRQKALALRGEVVVLPTALAGRVIRPPFQQPLID